MLLIFSKFLLLKQLIASKYKQKLQIKLKRRQIAIGNCCDQLNQEKHRRKEEDESVKRELP